MTISGWCGTAATQTLALLLRPPWTLEGLNMYKTSLLELVFGSLKGCRDFLFSIFVRRQIGCATASASTCASPLKSTSLLDFSWILTVPSFTELPPGGHAPWLVRWGGRGPSGPLNDTRPFHRHRWIGTQLRALVLPTVTISPPSGSRILAYNRKIDALARVFQDCSRLHEIKPARRLSTVLGEKVAEGRAWPKKSKASLFRRALDAPASTGVR